jgi:death-on-curing protein
MASLSRPRSGYYASLSEQAAALLQSLALNHIFIDGDKRVAFAGCAVFLDLNGFALEVDAAAAERFLIERVITEHAELAAIAQWLEAHMRPR